MISRFRVASAAVLAALSVAGAGFADDIPRYGITGRIIGPDGGWDYAAFDTTARRLFVSRTDGVMAVDVDTDKVTPHLVAGARVHSSLPLPDGLLLVTNGTSDTAVIADARDGTVKATIPTGKNPDAAVYDARSGMAFVMNGKSGDITVIDPKAGRAVGQIEVGGTLEFAAVDGAGHLFVNVEDAGEIAAIDLLARKVTARYKLKGCEDPSGLAYVTKGALLIAACANRHAKVVQAKDGAEVVDLAVGPRPDAVLYDEARGLAFIPSGGDGTLAVISVADPAKIAVVQTVTTHTGARTIAMDPTTGRLYLPVAKMGPPPADGGRSQMVPGSFEVLVVSPRGAAALQNR